PAARAALSLLPDLRHRGRQGEGLLRPADRNALPAPKGGDLVHLPPAARRDGEHDGRHRACRRRGPRAATQGASARARATRTPLAAAAPGEPAGPPLLPHLLRPHARAPLGNLAQCAALPGRAAPDAVVGTCGDRGAAAAPPPAASSSRLRARRVL